MKARFMIEKPEEIECTMKITMSIEQWIELRDQLNNKWPSCDLTSAINQVVGTARKVYYADETEVQ